MNCETLSGILYKLFHQLCKQNLLQPISFIMFATYFVFLLAIATNENSQLLSTVDVTPEIQKSLLFQFFQLLQKNILKSFCTQLQDLKEGSSFDKSFFIDSSIFNDFKCQTCNVVQKGARKIRREEMRKKTYSFQVNGKKQRYARLIVLLLLIGNLESNPGPVSKNKNRKSQLCKRLQCKTCHQFVSQSSSCQKCKNEEISDISNTNSLYLQNPASQHLSNLIPGQLYHVIDNQQKFVFNALHFMQFCEEHGFSYQLEEEVASFHSTTYDNLSSYEPLHVKQIIGDGDCLFSSILVSIGAQLSSTYQFRQKVVQFMSTVVFPTEILEAFIPGTNGQTILCSTVLDYIHFSKMEQHGIYGTCVEIFTAAQLLQCNILVYSQIVQIWVQYSSRIPTNNQIFIQHNLNGNHFEVITGLQRKNYRIQSAIEESTEVIDFSDEKKRKFIKRMEHQRKNTLSTLLATQDKFTATISNHARTSREFEMRDRFNFCDSSDKFFSNYFLEEEKDEYCANCMRCATSDYPLQFSVTNTRVKYNKKFCLFSSSEVEPNLCKCCTQYLTETKNDWSKAWPSVLYSILKDKNKATDDILLFYGILPVEFRKFWRWRRLHLHPVLNDVILNKKEPEPLLIDITQRKQCFQQRIQSFQSSQLVEALDDEPFPSVRCPFGCFSFLEEDSSISFQHLLNYIFPEITAFNASYYNHLRGMRKDFLTPISVLECFTVSAALKLDENKGVQLHCCTAHNNGSGEQFIHPPTHPILKNLTPLHEERLGLITPTLRNISCTKPNFSSHTYHLTKAVGNYSGLSSIKLSRKRRWDVTSDILASAEKVALNNRFDTECLMQTIATEDSLKDETIKEMYLTDVENERKTKSLKLASRLNTESINRLKNFVDIKNQSSSKIINRLEFLTFSHPNDEHGATPSPVGKSHIYEWLLKTISVSSPSFCNNLSKSLINKNRFVPILKLLNDFLFPKSKTDKLCYKNSKQAVIHLFGSDETKFLTIKDQLNNFCNMLDKECAFIHYLVCTTRRDISKINSEKILKDCDCVMITNHSSNTRCNKGNIPISFVNEDRHFELRYVGAFSQNSLAGKVLLRHGKEYQKFWLYEFDLKNAKKTQQEPSSAIDFFIKGYWDFVIYYEIKTNDLLLLRQQFFTNLTGQGKIFCESHNLPLTKDIYRSNFKCKCGKKSFLRCPINQCGTSICRYHTTEHLKTNVDQNVSNNPINDNINHTVPDNQLATEAENVDKSNIESDQSDDSSDKDSVLSFNVVQDQLTDAGPLAESIDLSQNPDYTTMGIDCNNVSTENTSLPLHILLNSECGLLQRKNSKPIHVSTKYKRFIENMVATSPKMSVSLAQPEAMMYPSIFWNQRDDCSYDGALPSSLYDDCQNNRKLGFSGIEDMLTTRIKDGTLQTSTSITYIQYVFDVIMNLQLRSSNVITVLNRGWQEVGCVKQCNQYVSDKGMNFEYTDSKKNVNQLASALRDQMATYFFTYTCSQSTHPSVRKIFSAIEKFCEKCSFKDEYKKTIIQSQLMTMLRSWQRASRLVMNYICKSTEQPLGPVERIWYRYEFQDKTAGFPHIHALIWTNEDPFSNRVRERVCCSLPTFLFKLPESYEKSIEKKNEIGKLFHKYQTHDCKKAQFRCHKKTDKIGRSICRVPKYPRSFCYSYKKIFNDYSDETANLFLELGLAQIDETTSTLKLNDILSGGKHQYPAEPYEHISPMNSEIFALVQSSINLQICDKVMSARYIAKYAAGIETRATANFSTSNESNVLKVNVCDVENSKIAGVKASKKNDKPSPITARVLSITETLWWILKLPYVSSNMEFIHIPTLPKEYRSGLVKEKKTTKKMMCQFGESSRVREEILNLPMYRRFTVNQKTLCLDVEKSSISPDKITIFGLRPPELLFVDSPRKYFRFFSRQRPKQHLVSSHEKLLKFNQQDSPWVDALGYIVYLNSNFIKQFQRLITKKLLNSEFNDPNLIAAKENFLTFFSRKIQSNFIKYYPTNQKNQVFVYSNVLPLRPVKFIVHFILRFGKFITELDLFNNFSLRESFRAAKLITSINPTIEDVKRLTRKYITKELRFLPGSSKLMDKFAIQCYNILYSALMNDTADINTALPHVLDAKISEYTSEVLKDEIENNRQQLLKCLSENKIEFSVDTNETSIVHPTLTKGNNQSLSSFKEQTVVFERLCRSIDVFCSGKSSFVKHKVLVGPPGTGKTFLMLNALAYALKKKLNCIITSLAAERSASLYGKHINTLFPFPVLQRPNVQAYADKAITILARQPLRTNILKHTDVFLIEEVSMISAELWAAMDLVLQSIMDNQVPFGGKLVIATGDFHQLPPPSGTLLLNSSSVFTTFDFFVLNNFVRMQNDIGRKLLTLLTKIPTSESNINEICKIISDNCIFSCSWKDVAADSLRVFSTRKAEFLEVQRKITSIKENSTINHCSFAARDEMCVTNTENWQNANPCSTKLLNRVAPEPQDLFVFEGAIIRLTKNMHDFSVFQGQLGVVEKICENNNKIHLAVAPPGIRSFPENPNERNNWKKIIVKAETGVAHRLNDKTICRRVQFPLKLFTASTIHKTMGDTLFKIATQITSDKEYRLWMREQLYVLISRVRDLNNITFVGDKNQTLEEIRTLLKKQSQWSSIIEQLYTCNNLNSKEIREIDLGLAAPLSPKHIELPKTSTGYCYLIESLKQPRLFYIGSTSCLKKRLAEHNSGHGTDYTKPVGRRPWFIVAYVTGFTAETMWIDIQNFEITWQSDLGKLVDLKQNVTVKDALSVARTLVNSDNCDNLTLVKCTDLI